MLHEMRMKSSIWILEIVIFVCFYIAICFGIVLSEFSSSSAYVSDAYYRNWNSTYITDIIISKDSNCPDGYSQDILGLWSGFPKDSCVCVDSNTKFQTTGMGGKECEGMQKNLKLVCSPIPSKDPIILSYFEGITVCLKKSKQNYRDMWAQVDTYLNSGPERAITQENFFQNYIKLKSSPEYLIEPGAIVDIKLVNFTIMSEQNIKKIYNLDFSREAGWEQNKIADNYYLFIKRIPDKYSILDMNSLVLNLRLFNFIKCSALDIDNNRGIEGIDFRTCKGMDREEGGDRGKGNREEDDREEGERVDNNGFYNAFDDEILRTENILLPFDNSITINDIYEKNGVNDFYKILSQNISFPLQTNLQLQNTANQPQIVYEKYLTGVGCPIIKSVDDHIEKMNAGSSLKMLSKAFEAFSYLIVVLSFIFMCLRINNNCIRFPRLFYILLVIILLLTILCLLISFSHAVLIGGLTRYLKEFSFYCLNDFSGNGVNINNRIIKNYYESLFVPLELAGFVAFVEFCNAIFLICYIIFTCCCNKKEATTESNVSISKDVEIYEDQKNKNKEMQNIHQDFHELDKSDVKSKI